MKHSTKTTLASALCAASLFACAEDAAQGSDSPSHEPGMLASVDVNGSRVMFMELEQGSPMVSATSAPGNNPLADDALAGMDLVEMYEYWTHQPAPESLRAAIRRKLALSESDFVADGEEPSADQAPEPASRGEKAALSAAEFSARYCSGYPVCFLDVTGTGELERRTNRVSGWVNPRSGGPVRLQIRLHKVVGGWRNILVQDIPLGLEYRYDDGNGGTVARPTKVKVHEADGDIYHWSMRW